MIDTILPLLTDIFGVTDKSTFDINKLIKYCILLIFKSNVYISNLLANITKAEKIVGQRFSL